MSSSDFSDEQRNMPLSGRNNPQIEPEDYISWIECEDIYEPKIKEINYFCQEKQIRPQNSRAYITQNVYDTIIQHLKTNLSIEQGGILFGNAYKDPRLGIIYVEVTAAVPALETVGTGVHLQFTPDSWSSIMNQARR